MPSLRFNSASRSQSYSHPYPSPSSSTNATSGVEVHSNHRDVGISTSAAQSSSSRATTTTSAASTAALASSSSSSASFVSAIKSINDFNNVEPFYIQLKVKYNSGKEVVRRHSEPVLMSVSSDRLSSLKGTSSTFDISDTIYSESAHELTCRMVEITVILCLGPNATQAERLAFSMRRKQKVGQITIDWRTLATGPVHHNLVLKPSVGNQLVNYRLEFDSLVVERTICKFTLSNAVVSFHPHLIPEDSRCHRFYLVTTFKGDGKVRELTAEKLLRENELICATLPPFQIEATLQDLACGKLVVEIHDANMHNSIVGYVCIPLRKYWQCRYKETASVVEEIRREEWDFVDTMENPSSIPAHDDTSGFQGYSLGVFKTKLHLSNTPALAQMKGGVHTESGIANARPLIYGALLPLPIRRDATLCPGMLFNDPDWVHLVDSFGYEYFHHLSTQNNSWFNPKLLQDPERDLLHRNSKMLASGIQIFEAANGATLFIHPKASRSIAGSSAGESALDSSRGFMSPISSTSDTENEVSGRRANRANEVGHVVGNTIESFTPRALGTGDETNGGHAQRAAPAAGFPSLFDMEDVAEVSRMARERALLVAKEAAEQSKGVARITDDNGCATEMRWERVLTKYGSSGPGSEGHTLTPILGGSMVYKFGGGCGRNWMDTLYSFNVDTLQWNHVQTIGPVPIGRTGHCAVSLGMGTRLGIFGGTSRTGRNNDMHMLDVHRSTWTPISLSSEVIPPKRSRASMCALEGGTAALLFGGREGYRFLGDKYYNDLHIFDASRVEWLKVKTRGGLEPEPRAGHISELINGRQLFVQGGMDDGARFYSESWLFDTVSFQWTKTPYPNEPSPGTRESHASALVGGAVVTYGGNGESGQLYNDVWVFNTANLRWAGTPVISGPSPGVRTGARAAPLDDRRMIVVGGDSGFSFLDDSYVLEVAYTTNQEVMTKTQLALDRGKGSDTCVICMDNEPSVIFLW
eukprot:CAMPEP_0184704760 /NCGR_PEP_ID=MMETSP0313-20130426/32233_1 /TAXON_ID=2792 /ORGANISM="Porphyridium aerugineum, Strain SAG 1380-2" /LENGTH=979 /DNA_ID=CAMNT_0027165911 /DNA_START=589 /DNA_END=3525 /DNA_ORIENTATION=+